MPGKINSTKNRWDIFISYRRSPESERVAKWIKNELEKESIQSTTGQIFEVCVFVDVTEPHRMDFQQNLVPVLEHSRALIVLADHGSAIRNSGEDYLYLELDWWAKSRSKTPFIVVQLDSGSGKRLLDDKKFEKWKKINCQDCFIERWKTAADGGKSEQTLLIHKLRTSIRDYGQIIHHQEVLRLKKRAVIAMIFAFAAMTAACLAYWQKIEVQKQRDIALHIRDKAQELNSFFIIDLRTKLRSLGRIELLEEATLRVLDYHNKLPEDLINNTAVLHTKAVAMDYMGQLALNKGNAHHSIKLLEESRMQWQALTNRKDSGNANLAGYFVNGRMLGEAYGAAGMVLKQIEIYRASISGIEAMHSSTPASKSEKNRNLSDLLTALGGALFRTGDNEGALKVLDQGALKAKDSTEADPKDILNWGQAVESFGALARFYRQSNDLENALLQAESAEDAARTMENMDTENIIAWRALADSAGVKAGIFLQQHNWIEAEKSAAIEVEWCGRLSRRDPLNPSLLSQKANAHDNLAYALDRQNKIEEAMIEYNQSIVILTKLTHQFPTRRDWYLDLAIVFSRKGDMAFESQVWDMALSDYDKSLKIYRELSSEDINNIRIKLSLANRLLAFGETLWKLNELEQAEKAFIEAETIVRSTSVSRDDSQAGQIRKNAGEALQELRKQLK